MEQDPRDFTPGAATDEPASSPRPPAGARHDGFGAERKTLFLTALRQGASVLHACALVGVSNRTAYNHRRRDLAFAEAWRLARGAHKLPLELIAWQRAVEGVEEQVWRYGKPSHVRTHHSDSLLRLLLAGEQPGKYGRRAALRPDLLWLKETVVECIAAETAPLEAALAAALDEIACLKARRDAPPGQIVNFMNPRVTRPRPANDAACREARGPQPPADAAGQAGSRGRKTPIDASAVNFARASGYAVKASLPDGRVGRGGISGDAPPVTTSAPTDLPHQGGGDRLGLHALCTEPTFDSGHRQVYRARP